MNNQSENTSNLEQKTFPLKPLPEWIVLSCKRVEPVGSRIVCNPPPTDTDQDWLCLLHDNITYDAICDPLAEEGWIRGGSTTAIYGSKPKFYSWTMGEDNIILTKDEEYFSKYLEATAICKEKNLLDKKERIKVFKKILGKSPKSKAVFSKSKKIAGIIGSLNATTWPNTYESPTWTEGTFPAIVIGGGETITGHIPVTQQSPVQPSPLLQSLLGNIDNDF